MYNDLLGLINRIDQYCSLLNDDNNLHQKMIHDLEAAQVHIADALLKCTIVDHVPAEISRQIDKVLSRIDYFRD